MLQPVGAVSPAAAYSGGAPAFASLQAQLQRYEQQLSECVNCASAKTPKGKADIDAISARIGQVKARMAQADDVQPAPTPQPRAPQGLGGRIDVYA